LILYVEANDFPLKGALIECGIALAAGVPIFVYTNAELEGRTMRPLGSWILDSRVTRCESLQQAIDRAAELSSSAPAAASGHTAGDGLGVSGGAIG
jgi:hypothetical protein